MNFIELERRYQTDAAFNKMVNLFSHLIEEYQFLPSEIREGLFLAQYKFEIGSVQNIIRTQKDWDDINTARQLMRDLFVNRNGNQNEQI